MPASMQTDKSITRRTDPASRSSRSRSNTPWSAIARTISGLTPARSATSLSSSGSLIRPSSHARGGSRSFGGTLGREKRPEPRKGGAVARPVGGLLRANDVGKRRNGHVAAPQMHDDGVAPRVLAAGRAGRLEGDVKAPDLRPEGPGAGTRERLTRMIERDSIWFAG